MEGGSYNGGGNFNGRGGVGPIEGGVPFKL